MIAFGKRWDQTPTVTMQGVGRSHSHVNALAMALAALLLIGPESACAQGFFDFLFGGLQRPAPPQHNLPPPVPNVGRVAPVPLAHESVSEGGSTGHAVAHCVRLCDGQHFPIERMVNATPADICHANCPYSKTKVFFGSEIGGAVASDGQHYGNLDTAFLYRKQLVAQCTCNGRDAFGIVSIDVKSDPTLRPGDIVSTNEGLLAFTGKSGHGASFTPVDAATLPPDIKPTTLQSSRSTGAEEQIDDEPGTIVPSEKHP